MNENKPEIKKSINIFAYLYVGLIFYFCLLFVCWGIGPALRINFDFLPLGIISGIIGIPMLIFLINIIARSDQCIKSLTNQQYPKKLDQLNLDHDAIIICQSKGIHAIGLSAGIDNLVDQFIKRKYPFKIYPCNNPEEFKSVLKNDKAKYLWIFSHGWCGGVDFIEAPILTLDADDLIYESLRDEIPLSLKKDFIGQFHCNKLSSKRPNVTLPEILMINPTERDYYVTNWTLDPCSVWFATLKWSQKIQRTPIAE